MPQRLTKIERATLRKEIGERLRTLRKASGFSRNELSKCLNLTLGHIGLIERGERGLTAEMLINIGKIFNCSMDYLLTGTESNAPRTPVGGSRQAMEIDRMLDEKSKQKLAEFVRLLIVAKHRDEESCETS